MLSLGPLFLTLAPFPLRQAGSEPLASRIEEVTLYQQGARVRRLSDPVAGRTELAFAGLPGALEPESVRARCAGGHVVNVEVRARVLSEVPEARLADLRARVQTLEREIQRDEDALRVEQQLALHVASWMERERAAFAAELDAGPLASEAWSERIAFLSERLGQSAARSRDIRARQEARAIELEDLRGEVGRTQESGGVPVHDVLVKVAPGAADARVDLDYFVPTAGWTPAYELRTARDARSVDLAFRARAWQRSGEDWRDVRLFFSTAEPQRGAQGPDPEPLQAGVHDPRRARGEASVEAVMERPAEAFEDAPASAAGTPMATVRDEGLSVRFELARPETIESREEPRTVLLARATLAVTPEYFCAPRLDAAVWLRGVARNTSDWPLLAGQADVHFGDDYLGHAPLESVERGEEFTLHLGPVDGLTVDCTRTGDLNAGPGFFSSARKRTEHWRVRFENLDPPFAAPDGSVQVIVREAIPRPTDDRIEVRLLDVTQPVSEEERWEEDRTERGIHTWVVNVPRGGRTDLGFGVEVSFPEGYTLHVR